MNLIESYFGVAIFDKDGWIVGDGTGAKLFRRKSDAMRSKRELQTQIDAVCQVVRVRCQFEILDRRIRRIR